MVRKLLIVESPTKCSTLTKYLDNSFLVLATYGHIRETPKQASSVDINNNFHMKFQIIAEKKRNLDKIIQQAIKANIIYLATDCDREGEGISWHILEVLKPHLKDQKIYRITFNEITKSALLHALSSPRDLNQDLVNAYKARSILDFLVGFHVSPVLWQKLGRHIPSAGRVQSPALRLLKERQDSIANFKPEEYWKFDIQTDIGSLQLKETNQMVCDKLSFKSKDEADRVLDKLQQECHQVVVTNIVKRLRYIEPPLPFTTATLQQEASSSFKISLQKIMSIAQNLYEGIKIDGESTALITYMRTDAHYISEEARTSLRQYTTDTFGADQNTPVDRKSNKKANKHSQEAHEAIRPVNILLTPQLLLSKLTEEQFNIYNLIWRKTVASQMIRAKTYITTVTLTSENKNHIFTCSTTLIKELGWKRVYNNVIEEQKNKEILDLQLGQIIEVRKVTNNQNFTTPPHHYTNSSLVKRLDALGIGRPSTYVSIVNTLKHRVYIEENKNQSFNITHNGNILINFLNQCFTDYIDYKFTAKMEQNLDKIAKGKLRYDKFLNAFWTKLSHTISLVEQQPYQKESIVLEDLCPSCNTALELKDGMYSKYISCRNCKYIKKEPQNILADKACPLCKSQLRTIESNKHNKFIGCTNFPKCKYTESISDGELVVCPKCQKNPLVKKFSKIKNNSFYACAGYPECSNIYSLKPCQIHCLKCDSSITLEASNGNLICPSCKSHQKAIPIS